MKTNSSAYGVSIGDLVEVDHRRAIYLGSSQKMGRYFEANETISHFIMLEDNKLSSFDHLLLWTIDVKLLAAIKDAV